MIRELNDLVLSHEIWNNPLLKAFKAKDLSREDISFCFSQYFYYSKNFTRLIALALSKCENEYFRSKLIDNLKDELGDQDPEKSHAQIFRKFLKNSLQIDYERIECEAYTENFVNTYYTSCLYADSAECAAMLSFGTEAIVPRLYSLFKEGLLYVGLKEEELEFFNIHIACDDEHAETLKEMTIYYQNQPHWLDKCKNAILKIIALRDSFFKNLYQDIQYKRFNQLIHRITVPLSSHEPEINDKNCQLYENVDIENKINFKVDRLDLRTEILDPRMVYIKPGFTNELHSHAHETLLFILSGEGEVVLNERIIFVKKNSIVHVPRWISHQTKNTGKEELSIFAITDYGLTKKIPKNTESVYRMK